MVRSISWTISTGSSLTSIVFIAGGKAVAAVVSAEDGDAIVKTALDAFGGVHALVANAGVIRPNAFEKMTDQEWDEVMAVHLRQVVHWP